MHTLASVISLLLSTALLLTGHGMQLTLLPLRASHDGISDTLIGISASCYFLGFVVGCLVNPGIIARVGHIRAFAVLTALMISVILALELAGHWSLWLVLRFLTGVAICGLYSVIESWLNTQASSQSRRRILAIYTFVTLSAMTGGQFLINVGPVDSSVPFTVAALCMALAILPVGLTRRMAPEPVTATRVQFSLLFSRSRSAFAGGLLSGLVAGSFWSLGALFAQRYMDAQLGVTLFMSVAIAGGAVMQYPIGWLSDRTDRRKVLLCLCLAGVLFSGVVALSPGQPWFLPAVFLFGAAVMPLYAISLATAADVSERHEFVEIGTAVLLLSAIGSALAPLALGPLMAWAQGTALFWAFAVFCALFAIYLALQLRVPRAITVADQAPFSVATYESAPAAFEMDPRTTEHGHPGAAHTASGAAGASGAAASAPEKSRGG